VRNDNYWEKNPIGLGKGDQLPYLEGRQAFNYYRYCHSHGSSAPPRSKALATEYDDVKEFLENPKVKSMMYTMIHPTL